MSAPTMSAPTLRTAVLVPALILLLGSCGMRPVVEQAPGHLPGAATYSWETTEAKSAPPPDSGQPSADGIRDAIDQALNHRGYHLSPAAKAAWRISYQTRLETKQENIAPKDKMLVPRMVCGLHECVIVQDWIAFGPPTRASTTRAYQEKTLQVEIRDARTGQLVWRGQLADEVEEESGRQSRTAVYNDVKRLLDQLPAAH